MSYPQWKDNPSEMVTMLRHAAMDAVLGQGGLVGQTLYAQAADRLHALECELERVRGVIEAPTNEAMWEVAKALDEEVRDKAPASDMATCLIRYKAAWDRIVAPIRASLQQDSTGRIE